MTEAVKPRTFGADGISARSVWPFVALVCELAFEPRRSDSGRGRCLSDDSNGFIGRQGCLGVDALMLQVMLIAMLAGALADMHDRRLVALVSLGITLAGAIVLTALAWLNLVTPNILLALHFAVASGMALLGPAWQSSISEQVPSEALPARLR